jgi:hypothetical protein
MTAILSAVIVAEAPSPEKTGRERWSMWRRSKPNYEALPLKTDHAPLLFGRRAHVVPRSRQPVQH